MHLHMYVLLCNQMLTTYLLRFGRVLTDSHIPIGTNCALKSDSKHGLLN
jgi:hypothetical protein